MVQLLPFAGLPVTSSPSVERVLLLRSRQLLWMFFRVFFFTLQPLLVSTPGVDESLSTPSKPIPLNVELLILTLSPSFTQIASPSGAPATGWVRPLLRKLIIWTFRPFHPSELIPAVP